MTTSTPSASRAPIRGFTLVEVLIAATLSAFVLAGVLSSFLFISRTSFRASAYSEMESEVRRGLETIARDIRNASDVHWNSAQSVTLTVNGAPVTYAYDGSAASATYRSFYRLPGDAGSTQPRAVLIRSLDPDFTFRRYKVVQPGINDNTATTDAETKQLQLVLRTRRTNLATTGASQAVVSSRYVLRNKPVAH
jgi:prepilin-type N-terminal cleavage/methylation domain-containing protein